jgi:O-antigen/teichoic acid export membrane protein
MSSFVANVVKLSIGTIIAQVLGILVAPILTRLFDPEAFGLLGLFTSISSIIGAIACLRYDLAIMLPEQDQGAVNLFAGSLLSAVFISSLSSLLIWVGGQYILNLLNASQLIGMIWYVPLMVFLIGTFSAASYWNTRTENFGRLSFVKIINSFISNFAKLAMGLGGHVSGGILIFATLLAQFISNLFLFSKIFIFDRNFFLKHIQLREIFNVFYRYRRFPKYAVWSGILVDLSLKLPIFIIAYFFSARELGLFVFVQTIVRVPFNLLGESISKVFFQRAATIRENRENLSQWIETVFYFLTSFFMLPALILSILGEDMFNFIFGSNWSEAGIYAQILAFSILVEFITAPLGSLFNVLEKQKEALQFNILLMALRLSALIAGGVTGNIFVLISIFVIADMIARSAKFTYIFRQSHFKIARATGIILKAFALAVPFIFCLIFFKFILNFGALVNIWLAVLMIMINYFLLMHRNDLIKAIFNNHSQNTLETY